MKTKAVPTFANPVLARLLLPAVIAGFDPQPDPPGSIVQHAGFGQ